MKNQSFPAFIKNPLTFFLVIIALFSFARALNYSGQFSGVDFYQFWIVGKAIRQLDVKNIYSDADRKKAGSYYFQQFSYDYSQKVKQGIQISDKQVKAANFRQELETYSTPFLYMVFYLSSFNSYDFDIQFYLTAALVLYVAAIILLCRLLGYQPQTILVLIPILTLFFRPFYSEIRVVNVNQIQLVALILFVCIQSRFSRLTNLAGGFVLGLAVMFKPNLIFVAVMLIISWIINRRFKKLFQTKKVVNINKTGIRYFDTLT